MKNIWRDLPRPFFVQAPMEDVTDTVFRQIVALAGKPDLFFTEFTNADGIIKGSDDYIKRCLQFTKTELPLIAQIWGTNPEYYKKSADLLFKMGFSGIDINMGCPVRDIIKNGSCAALINNPDLAKQLYLATVNGAKGLPVSIKTRLGFSKIQTEEWIGFLLSLNPAAITVHARTAKEMSKVPVHSNEYEKIVRLRNKISPETLIVANGDIENREQGLNVVAKYRVDGVMIGRGILHNPWVFSNIKPEDLTISKRLTLLRDHLMLYDKTWKNRKNFEIMKKFYKAYLSGFEGANDMRLSLMQFYNAKDTIKYIDKFIKLKSRP